MKRIPRRKEVIRADLNGHFGERKDEEVMGTGR